MLEHCRDGDTSLGMWQQGQRAGMGTHREGGEEKVGITKLIQPWGAETARGQLRKWSVHNPDSALLLQGTGRGAGRDGSAQKGYSGGNWAEVLLFPGSRLRA